MRKIMGLVAIILVVVLTGCATTAYKDISVFPETAGGALAKAGNKDIVYVGPTVKQSDKIVQIASQVPPGMCEVKTTQGEKISPQARKALGTPEFAPCPPAVVSVVNSPVQQGELVPGLGVSYQPGSQMYRPQRGYSGGGYIDPRRSANMLIPNSVGWLGGNYYRFGNDGGPSMSITGGYNIINSLFYRMFLWR